MFDLICGGILAFVVVNTLFGGSVMELPLLVLVFLCIAIRAIRLSWRIGDNE